MKFSDYLNDPCVNNAYQDFFIKFLSVLDSAVTIRTLRVKYNTKPSFDIPLVDLKVSRYAF